MFPKYYTGFCIALFLLISAPASAQQININPSILSFNVKKGESSIQNITISNYSGKKQAYRLTLGDWERDSMGGHRYFAPNTQSRSCAAWIKLDNNFVELDPGQSKIIRVTLDCPNNEEAVKEAKWAMLFIEGLVEQKGAADRNFKVTTNIREVYRVGVHLYQTPPEINHPAAKAVSLIPDPKSSGNFIFKMENTGNIMLNCTLRVELTNIASGKTVKEEIIEFPVFPNAQRLVPLSIPNNIPNGKYSLVALLDYHDDVPLEGIETLVEIKN